jgi:cytochrome c553
MRHSVLALALLAAACGQQAKPTARSAEITFDGALTADKAAQVRHGERLIHALGCTGCHGAQLEGMFITKDEPQYGPLYASNLTVEIPEYSDVELDGIIRKGVHPERKTVWAMPSQIFQHLSDADTEALIAFLRTLKPVGKKLPPPQFSKTDKEEIASAEYKPSDQLVRETRGVAPIDLGPQFALGRYVTEVTCAECHGPKLEGDPHAPMGRIPNLVVAGGYTRAEFERLMVQGVAAGNRKINPVMAGVARTRFSHFTPHERDALYAYLKARAQRS